MLHAMMVSLAILGGAVLGGGSGAMARATMRAVPSTMADPDAMRWAFIASVGGVVLAWSALALSLGA